MRRAVQEREGRVAVELDVAVSGIGTRESGLGTRDSRIGIRESGFGTRESGDAAMDRCRVGFELGVDSPMGGLPRVESMADAAERCRRCVALGVDSPAGGPPGNLPFPLSSCPVSPFSFPVSRLGDCAARSVIPPLHIPPAVPRIGVDQQFAPLAAAAPVVARVRIGAPPLA